MTEQMRILTKRLRRAPAVFRRLNRKLLKVGGQSLVIHPCSNNEVAEMVFRFRGVAISNGRKKEEDDLK